MNDIVEAAFHAVCDGYPPDRVLADPDLNQRFIAACRESGLSSSIRDLNLTLLALRKSKRLSAVERRRRTTFSDRDQYRHASEVAARYMENKHHVSWDEILCSPELIAEFDAHASAIAPGYDSLRYRWAVFTLRKARKLKPELLSRVVPSDFVALGPVARVDVQAIPSLQGLYVFIGPDRTLYVGEARDLRKRIAKHLDHSDNKGLARWLWEHGIADAHLEIRTLPPTTSTRVRRALEAELIASRRPLFNFQPAKNRKS